MSISQQGSLLLSKFIKRNYSRRVVEVGCGKHSRVASALSRSLEIIATDVLESEAVDDRIRPLYTKDDITSPDLQLYRNSQLLYSIRPPLEIQHGMLNVAQVVHADVLIKPLGNEITEVMQAYLRNYHGIAFYHFRGDTALRHRTR